MVAKTRVSWLYIYKLLEKILKNLFWIDLEMSGLDVEKEVIIEAAAIVTDFDFKILDQYHSVVKQDQKYIDQMDDWNKKHHGESGLIEKIPLGKEALLVEKELCAMIDKNFPKDRPMLAGNSISQDRLFIDKYFKTFATRLHYRILDVSSWKIVFNEKYNIKYQKKNTHRALEDIQESISELQFYLEKMKL